MKTMKLCIRCEEKVRDGYKYTEGFSLVPTSYVEGTAVECDSCHKTFRSLQVFEFCTNKEPKGDGTCRTCKHHIHLPDEIPCSYCSQSKHEHKTDIDFYKPNDN